MSVALTRHGRGVHGGDQLCGHGRGRGRGFTVFVAPRSWLCALGPRRGAAVVSLAVIGSAAVAVAVACPRRRAAPWPWP